ncbi:hypothetical protein R3P38DRAFT_2436258, partial [Favolaschia claudopus]
DTRVYPTSRLLSFHGYDAPAYVDDGFDHRLPPGLRYYGREVETSGRRYELWSPNSIQTPYYPGIRFNPTETAQSRDELLRRYDGQLGKFDYSIVPQYYDPRFPWRGFMV